MKLPPEKVTQGLDSSLDSSSLYGQVPLGWSPHCFHERALKSQCTYRWWLWGCTLFHENQVVMGWGHYLFVSLPVALPWVWREMETILLCDHGLLFWLPLNSFFGIYHFQKSRELKKVWKFFLLEKSLAMCLLFKKKCPPPFFLRYILHVMKCTNLKWTVGRIFAYMYPHAMTSHIKIEICLWLWWFPSSPSQSILSPPGSQHCDSYQIFGGLFAIMCAFSSDSWWSKLV